MSDLYLKRKRLPDSSSDEEDDFAWKVPCTILEQQQHSNNLNKEFNDCYHGDETNDETDDEIVTFAKRRHHEQQQPSNNLETKHTYFCDNDVATYDDGDDNLFDLAQQQHSSSPDPKLSDYDDDKTDNEEFDFKQWKRETTAQIRRLNPKYNDCFDSDEINDKTDDENCEFAQQQHTSSESSDSYDDDETNDEECDLEKQQEHENKKPALKLIDYEVAETDDEEFDFQQWKREQVAKIKRMEAMTLPEEIKMLEQTDEAKPTIR